MTEKKSDIKLSDLFKKVVTTGIGAAFMTEDAIKNAISDLPLPKELINGLLQNARNTKQDFVDAIKNELKNYLNSMDISKEIEKIVDQYDIEMKASFSFHKKEPKVSKTNKKNEK